MIQDTLKTEIKNDIKNALSKHGLMCGDKYAAEILQELATEFSKNIIVSSLKEKLRLERLQQNLPSLRVTQ